MYLAARNPLSAVAPSLTSERLCISNNRVDWLRMNGPVLKQSVRAPDLAPRDVLVEVKYAGLLMAYPEVNYSLESVITNSVSLWAGTETIGIVLQVGRDVRTFRAPDPVLVFSPFSQGPSTHVLANENKVIRIPAIAPKFLISCTPMITSSVIYDDYLVHLPRGSSILVSDAGTGTGLCLCDEGKKRGFEMFGITYTRAAYNLACGLTEDCLLLARGLHRRRTEVKGMLEHPTFYSVVIAQAILSIDQLQIYHLYADILVKNRGVLILLCTAGCVKDAARIMPMNYFASLGIAIRWFIINGSEHNFTDTIKANIRKLSTVASSPVVASAPLCTGLSVGSAEQEIVRTFEGTSAGYQYLKLN